MKYFQRLAENVGTLPLTHQLIRHPEWWNADKVRTTFDDSPHTAVSDILLRFGLPDGDTLEATDRPEFQQLIGAKGMVLDVMRMVGGSRLGRVIITKLEPGQKIAPHADVMGAYAHYYTRYHMVLQGHQGNLFGCGDESVHMLSGEIWWFDAHVEHWVANNSKDDRIHMLIDVRIDG